MSNLGSRCLCSGVLLAVAVACAGCTPSPPPAIVNFFAMPESIERDATSALFWSVVGADSVAISGGVGIVTVSGSCEVSPSVTTEYTLTATNATGVTTQSTRVDVKVSAPDPLSAAALPTGLSHPTLVEAIQAISPLVSETAAAMTPSTSDEGVMQGLSRKLRERGIQAGLVTIKGMSRGKGPLDACVAIATRDNGVALFTVLPSHIDVEPPEERLQVVYLQKGSRLGLLAATVAESMDYAWYTGFMEDVYQHYDYLKWLTAFADSVADYASHLARLIEYVENPPSLAGYFSDNQLAELDRLIDGANANIDQFKAVADELSGLVDALEDLPDAYPSDVYYVETIWTDPLRPLPALPSVPQYGVTLVRTTEEYLTELRRRVYVLPPTAPNRDDHKCERVSDKNFVVADFEIRW